LFIIPLRISLLCRILFFTGSIFFCPSISAQDYSAYHTTINRADEEIFLNNHLQKGMDLYAKAFKQYDFVFLSDCITALQMALYAHDEKDFLLFMDKAVENGLMPRHLDYRNMRYI